MKNLRLALTALITICVAGCVATTEGPPKSKPNMKDAALYNMELGVNYMRQGKFELALEKLQKSLEQDPRQADAHMAIAVLYEQIEEFDKADRNFRAAIRLDPKRPEYLNNYGAFLCRQDRYREGIKNLDRAANTPLYATPEAAYTNAGMCARSAENPRMAEQYFRKALVVNALYTEALLQLAILSFDEGYYLQTRAFIQRFLQASKPTPEVMWLGYRTEIEMDDHRAAERYATKLKRDFPESLQTRQLLELERNAG